MLTSTTREDATVYHLPGRDWLLCMGPGVGEVKNLTVGVSIVPPGSAPPGHVHEHEEEVIYVVTSRSNRMISSSACLSSASISSSDRGGVYL